MDRSDAEALIAIALRLEPRLLEGSLDQDGARALFQAAVRIAVMPTSLHSERPASLEADPRRLLEVACEAARLGGDREHQAYAYWRLGEHLRQSSADSEVVAEARAVFELALDEFPDARGMKPLLLIAWAKLERDFGSLAKTAELLTAAEGALVNAGPGFMHTKLIEHSIAGVQAELNLALGNLDRVARFVAEQEEMSAQSGRPELVLEAAVNRAKLLLASHRWSALEKHASAALERQGTGGGGRSAGLVLCRAIGRMRSGEPGARAKAKVDFAALLADAEPTPLHELTALTWLAELDLGAREFDQARARIDLARSRVASAGRAPTDLRAFEAETLLVALEGRLVRLEGEADARAMEEMRDRLERALENLLDRWRSVPEVRGGVGFLQYGGRRLVLSELVDAHLSQEDRAAGLDGAMRAVMRVQSLGSLARARGTGSDDWKRAVARLTAPGRGLLLYLPGVERLHVFALDRDGSVHVALPALGTLEELRADLVASVTNPPLRPDASATSDQIALAKRLGRLLLPARIADRVREWKELRIVGGDILGYVPFEALRPFGNEPLGVQVAISNLPSLPVGELLLDRREERRSAGERGAKGIALLAAPTIEKEDLARWPEALPIPFGPNERARLVGADQGLLHRSAEGEAASYGFLHSPFVREARVLELLTHGVPDSGRAWGTGLLLAPAGDFPRVLGYEDVRPLALPPLVVVAACGARKGPLRRGEDGVASLAGAFFEAGTSAVVLSPARLEYRAALGFLEAFNGSLMEGESPAEAARKARLKLRESGRPHPFHGLMQVVGLGHEPIFPRSR